MESMPITFYLVGIVATCVAAMLAFVLVACRRVMLPLWMVAMAIAMVPVMLLVGQLCKYASLHMYADVSHWVQLFQSLLATGRPYVANVAVLLSGRANYFSAHFVPLVYLLAIPFALFPYPQTLFVLNVAIMCSAAIPLYVIARHHTGDRRFALLAAALLLWYPTFQYTTLYEFEMLRFSIPILLWMVYMWDQKRFGWYYVFALLAVLVREEVGLTVGMFGVYLAFIERRRTHGIATALLGFGAFAVITQFVMPAFVLGDRLFAHVAAGAFGVPGNTPLAVLMNLLRHPLVGLASLAHPVKLANIAMLFIPLFGIPLLAPAALLPALPTFAIGFLSYSMIHSSFFLYYVTPAVPFVFIAFLHAWPKVIQWLAAHRREGVANAAIVAMMTAMLTVGVFFGPSPIALQFWSDRFRPAPFRTQSFYWSTYVVTGHHRAARAFIDALPETAVVATQQFLLPHLRAGQTGMVLPQVTSIGGQTHATHLLYDTTNNGLHSQSPAFVTEEEFSAVHASGLWVLLRAADGYELYERR